MYMYFRLMHVIYPYERNNKKLVYIYHLYFLIFASYLFSLYMQIYNLIWYANCLICSFKFILVCNLFKQD